MRIRVLIESATLAQNYTRPNLEQGLDIDDWFLVHTKGDPSAPVHLVVCVERPLFRRPLLTVKAPRSAGVVSYDKSAPP